MKKSYLFCFAWCIIALLTGSATACRLWAVIAQKGFSLSEGSSGNRFLISEELGTLYNEGESQANGWSLGFYKDNQIIDGQTLFRSPIPSTNEPDRFDAAVSTILDPSNDATVAIGHLRTASSGATYIPDPHPFLFNYRGICYSFVLNGSFDREPFMQLLTKGGKDSSWLFQHPPHTYGNGDWRREGFSSIVATELYLSWIMKNIAELGDVLSGLAAAQIDVYKIIPSACSRNVIFSDGRRLFVSGGSGCLNYSSTSYFVKYENNIYSINHQAVMTEPPNTGAAGEMKWKPVLDNQLVVLSPETTEIYSHAALQTLSNRDTITIKDAFFYDLGADGYIDSIYVIADSAMTPERVREISDSCLIGLPNQRKLVNRNFIPIDSFSFSITVNQDGSVVSPISNVNEYDNLTTLGHHFAVGGWLFADKTAIHDRIAPVIVRASLRRGNVDSKNAEFDTLCVKYSEPVTFPSHSALFAPFIFRRHHKTDVMEFSPMVSILGPSFTPSDSFKFVVVNFNHPSIDRLMENDSISISASADCTSDTVVPPNFQRNTCNISRAVSIDSFKGHPDDFTTHPYELLRIFAKNSGRVTLAIFSLSGRRISKSIVTVKKSQWVSLQKTGAGIQGTLARGPLLYWLSFGDIQKQGFIHAQQGRQLEVQIEN